MAVGDVMGLFDFFPTVEEVFDFAVCRLSGHKWEEFFREKVLYRRCTVCNKIERVL
jgi:hypothetical protein